MIASRMFIIAAAVLLGSVIASGQQVSCSCDPAPGRTCHGTIKCPDGCTSVCGPGDACYLSCRSNTFESRITAQFVRQTGQEIAAKLSNQTHQRIQFAPYSRNRSAKYDLTLNDDDLVSVLMFLNKRGKVRVNGLDFSELIELRRQLNSGKKISVSLIAISAQDALAKLAFLSGKKLRIEGGDPQQIISVKVQDATFDQILARISETAHVTIRK